MALGVVILWIIISVIISMHHHQCLVFLYVWNLCLSESLFFALFMSLARHEFISVSIDLLLGQCVHNVGAMSRRTSTEIQRLHNMFV